MALALLAEVLGVTADREAAIPIEGDVALFKDWLEESPYTGAWGVTGREILDRLLAELAAAREENEKLREALTTARTGLANVAVSGGVPDYVQRNVQHYLDETQDAALSEGES